jgi:hypothetical protein
MKKRKYKAPNTVAEILQHSNIKELADYLTDPKNNVIEAIIITRDINGAIHHDANEGLHEVELYGMLELAKKEFSTDFDMINCEGEDG